MAAHTTSPISSEFGDNALKKLDNTRVNHHQHNTLPKSQQQEQLRKQKNSQMMKKMMSQSLPLQVDRQLVNKRSPTADLITMLDLNNNNVQLLNNNNVLPLDLGKQNRHQDNPNSSHDCKKPTATKQQKSIFYDIKTECNVKKSKISNNNKLNSNNSDSSQNHAKLSNLKSMFNDKCSNNINNNWRNKHDLSNLNTTNNNKINRNANNCNSAKRFSSKTSVSNLTCPPQHWPKSGPRLWDVAFADAPRASIACAMAMACHSNVPPPIEP